MEEEELEEHKEEELRESTQRSGSSDTHSDALRLVEVEAEEVEAVQSSSRHRLASTGIIRPAYRSLRSYTLPLPVGEGILFP